MDNLENIIKQYTQKYNQNKELIEDIKKKQIIENNNLEHIEQQIKEVNDEISNLGYDPDTLKDEILKNLSEIKELNEKLEKAIPNNNDIPNDLDNSINILESLDKG